MNLIQTKKRRCIFTTLLIIICAYHCQIRAQNPEAYNKIYTDAYLNISQKDFPKALKIADSLFTISETPRYKAKSLMLSASLHQQEGEIEKAVDFASKAEETIRDTEEYVWKAKISGFLATQYRQLKLLDQSKKYIDETMESIAKISDPKIVNQTMGFVMQEKAYYEIETKNYKKSISFVKEANRYFDLSGPPNPFLLANNDQLFGLNYYYLKNYPKALNFYDNASEKLSQMPDNFLTALVLNGYAQIYIAEKKPKKAKEYIDHAQRIAEESKYLSLKNEIYATSQQYYALTNNMKQLQKVKIKQDSVIEKIEDKSSKFVSHSFSGLKTSNEHILKDNKNKTVLILISMFLICIGLVSFFFYRSRQKKNFAIMKQVLDEVKQSSRHRSESSEEDPEIEDLDIELTSTQVSNQPLMTYETEQKILLKLEKFEQSKLFIKNSVSLPFLASYCSTNTKYLSYVVNTYKKKDFTNYINELRVRYIIEKLNSNPQYLKYKISTLAEEAGFSSQSKFAASFRKVTSVSPSQFLEHLKTI